MHSLGRVSAVAGLALVGATFAFSAGAAALYFEKTAVKTGSEATCLRFASDTAKIEKFTNVHKGNSEVAGQVNGAYVAITCIGRGSQPAIAVVMSVANDFAVAKQVGQAAASRIKGIVCFDTPC